MASDDKYTVTLTGAQVDDALMQMNQRIPEGWAAGTRDGVAVSSTSQFYHNNAKYLATQAKSWAQGGTGERSGEDTNNAQYWAQQAQAAAGGGVSSFKGRTGAVQPQSGDYTAAMVGAMPADTSIPTKTSDLVNDEEFVGRDVLESFYVIAGEAEGVQVAANSTAEGINVQSTGGSSHAEGQNTVAAGQASHAEGLGTIANKSAQHVFGRCNIAEEFTSPTQTGQYIEIVGNGTSSSNRANARTLDWDGNEVLAGKLTVGAAPTANMDVATKKYVDDAIAAAIAALQNS